MAKKKPTSKKRRKPTEWELEQRVLASMRLIAAGLYDGEIKQAIATKYKCSRRTVERYIKAARAKLVERRGQDRSSLQAQSLSRYEAIIRKWQQDNSTIGHRDYLFACKRIDELLGLEEPRRTELSVPGGLEVKHTISDEPDPDEWDKDFGNDQREQA